MKRMRHLVISMLASALAFPLTAIAEDIDIYSGFGGAAGTPNVIIILDNAAAWNGDLGGGNCTYADDNSSPSLKSGSSGAAEQCALVNAVYALPDLSGLAKVNLGLMLFDKSSSGGRLWQQILPMTASGKSTLISRIKAITSGNDQTPNTQVGASLQETYAYFMGLTGISGTNYASLKPTVTCENNFIIFIGNASTQGKISDDSDATVKQKLIDAGANTTQQKQIVAGTKYDANWADEWARFMRQSVDVNPTANSGLQNIVTYTISVADPSKTNDDYVKFAASMANQGGGRAFVASTATEIKQAILAILNEVQAVNSVFSSSSLPVSVNAQGTYLNQIFVGMFRPDEHAYPRWMGNLKQYQLIYDNTAKAPRLADKNGNFAISSAKTGFITPNAISFWTTKDINNKPDDTTTGGFFINNAMGTDLNAQPNTYDLPDGEVVEKGGTAQQIRLSALQTNYTSSPSAPRKLYSYCPAGTGCITNLADTSNSFNVGNSAITNVMLGSATPFNVSSITRSGTTATVTTTTDHGFSANSSIFVSGANQTEYNGTFTVNTVPSTTTFTYTVPDYPPTTATGSYTASQPSSPKTVTQITRSGTTATVTLASHGYTTGQKITISGATQTEYNGTFTIAVVDTNTFTYTVPEGPATSAGSYTKTGIGANAAYSATATVGTSTKYIDMVGTGITRSAGSTTVTVTTVANHGFSTGNSATLANVADSTGNQVSQYNGTFSITKTGNKTFTFTISSTTPTSPATGSITADSGSAFVISNLSRSGTNATATTTSTHGFSVGQTVNIGGTAGPNEGAYVGSFNITGTTANTFNYTVVTSPVSPATGTITVAATGSVDRTKLINWIRGEDNMGDEASPGNGITIRPSVHGDVLHSRPAVVNYGDVSGNPRVVVFYGSNDGVFRAVNGNQSASIGSASPGSEMWGFIPSEFYGKFNRLRNNSPTVKVPTTPDGIIPTPQSRDYFIDGPTSLYQKLKSDKTTDVAYLYLTMRRGGRFIYALDVSDPVTPKFLWKKGCYPSGSCDTGFAEMGQTWSEPRVTRVKGYSNPVLIFGGGYDPAEDVEPPAGDTMGRGIFIVDAFNGNLVWSASYKASGNIDCSGGTSTKGACLVPGMNYAIPADITMLDRDGDGKIERLYAADTGGNVWRIDLEPPSGNTPDKWRIYKFAALGCDSGTCTSGTVPRKFFYRADVIPVGKPGLDDSYDAVMIGTGDREHPLYDIATGSAYSVTNRLYMLKDLKTVGREDTETAITQVAASPDGLFDASTTLYDGSRRGYFLTLATGEKVVNAPTTVEGFTFFGTNQPPTPNMASCDSKLGIARGYSLSLLTGKFTFVILDGGGMPPTAVAGVTTVKDTSGNNMQIPFCLGCTGGGSNSALSDCRSAIGACKNEYSGSTRRTRTYWYTQ